MMTESTIREYIATNGLESYRKYAAAVRENYETLITLYHDAVVNGRRPRDTIAALIDAVGYNAAAVAVATLVNMAPPYDVRVSTASHKWAAGIDDALDSDAAHMLWINGDAVHRCHVEQLAAAMAAALK